MRKTAKKAAAKATAKADTTAVTQAAGQAILDAAVTFDRLEDRQMMAAHVAGSAVSYPTIQSAVDAAPAGGTVTVDAGSYAESVTIGKPLTVQGAQAGVDARGNARQNGGVETVLTGATTAAGVTAAFTVAATGVTIDGFTIQGETSQSLYTGAGIVIAPGVSGTRVLNNVVQNNVAGLFLANATAANPALIQHNLFRGNNNPGTLGGRGIYTDQSISGGTLTNVTIDANSFLNNRGGTGTTGLESAIALESTSNAQSQTNINVTNNTFDSNGKAILAFNTTGLRFTGNTVTRGLDWYSGIVRFEGNDHDVTITGNNLYANTGPAVAVDTKGVPGDNSGFVVTGNNIYGNGTTSGSKYGLVVNGDVYQGTFDARNNYWGSASGPGGDGAGTGDSIYGAGHVMPGKSWVVTAGAGSELFAPYATAPVVAQDTAYWGLPAVDGAKVQAEDFNHGGLAVGYNDTTTGNSGGQYRTTGVDIESTSDAGGGFDVGWTAAGEWLDYAVNLTSGGTYRMDFRLASPAAGATFRVLVDGAQVGADTAVPNTGSWTTFQTVSIDNVSLTGGAHTVRVQFVANSAGGGGPNFNWFQLTNTAPLSSPTAPAGLTATANGSAEVDLAWANTAANAAGVTIQRSTDGVNYATLITLSASASSYADTGLSPLTTYTYRVLATNAGGASPATAAVAATTSPSTTTPTPIGQLPWTSATAGWSAPQVNQTIKNKTISLRGTTYATGIGTHASSTIAYTLAGRFGTFTADVGIDDETNGQGAADFQIYGDGKLLYDSGVLTGTTPVARAVVNVTGVQTLTLIAAPGVAGSIDYDHADWAGAQLTVAAPVPVVPAAPTNLTATVGSTSTVYLGWTNAATNNTGFSVDRSADGGATWTARGGGHVDRDRLHRRRPGRGHHVHLPRAGHQRRRVVRRQRHRHGHHAGRHGRRDEPEHGHAHLGHGRLGHHPGRRQHQGQADHAAGRDVRDRRRHARQQHDHVRRRRPVHVVRHRRRRRRRDRRPGQRPLPDLRRRHAPVRQRRAGRHQPRRPRRGEPGWRANADAGGQPGRCRHDRLRPRRLGRVEAGGCGDADGHGRADAEGGRHRAGQGREVRAGAGEDQEGRGDDDEEGDDAQGEADAQDGQAGQRVACQGVTPALPNDPVRNRSDPRSRFPSAKPASGVLRRPGSPGVRPGSSEGGDILG